MGFFGGLAHLLKSSKTERLITILVGPGMAAAAMLLSLVVVANNSLEAFPEIAHACSVTGIPASECVRGAHTAGEWSVAAFVLAIAAFLALGLLTKSGLWKHSPIHPLLTEGIVGGSVLLLIAHLAAIHFSPAFGLRIAELDRFGAFISLENVLWPFLVQLLLIEHTTRLRAALIAVLLAIMLLSPYRSVSLAIVAFAFVLPLIHSVIAMLRSGVGREEVIKVGYKSAAVVIVCAATLLNGVVDSEQRAASAPPVQVTNPQGDTLIHVGDQPRSSFEALSTFARLQQRLAYPLYQAEVVRHLSATSTLPTIGDEFARKFRLSRKPNLNEFTYRVIYPEQGAHSGETTSLYFGEGAAYFGNPVLWTLCAPLLFVAVWFLLSAMGIEASGILSIGIWRSSFAGLITMLPALLVQLVGIGILTWLTSALHSTGSLRRTVRFSSSALLAIMLIFAVLQTVNSVNEYRRKSLLRVTFEPAKGCQFVAGRKMEMQRRMDDAIALYGIDVRSIVTHSTKSRLTFVLPYGNELAHESKRLSAAMANYVDCETPLPKEGVSVLSQGTISARGAIALNVIVSASLLLSSLLLWRSRRGNRFNASYVV